MIKAFTLLLTGALLMIGLAGCDDSASPSVDSPHIIHVTDADFQQRVIEADKPVLVDFWAEWCGPCKVQAPVLSEVADNYAGKAIVAKLDIDAHDATATKYDVSAIPTMVLFVNGQEVKRFVGLTDRADIESVISGLIIPAPAAPGETPETPASDAPGDV